jgi:maltose alpha-D-glucosyltransferase/alpha-amylase
VYGYQVINVEAQQRSASSLFSAMRRLIAARKSSRVFGRGALRFLSPVNTRVLAYVRESADERVLVVANLAPSAEPVELDLRPWRGAAVVEMLGGSRFPPIGDQPYFLSLAPWGFYWLRLITPGGAPPTAYGIEGTAI